MANFKRGKCRWQTNTRVHSMRSYPRWWDIIFHTKPKRRAQQAMLQGVIKGRVDADDAAWPLGNHKPHNYYW